MSIWAIAILSALVAAFAGFALGRTKVSKRYLTESQTARGKLTALQQLTLTLSNTLVLDDIVGEIATFLRGFVHADGVLIALAPENAKSLQIASADGCLESLAGTEIYRDQAGLLTEALDDNRVAVSHPEDDSHPELVSGCGPHIAAVAPLETHGTIRGVIAAVRDGPEAFSSEDIRQLVTVAKHAAMALAHANLVEMMKRGKEQWEATFDALSTGIAVVDATSQIRRANKTLADILEKPVTEVTGLDLCSELPGDAARLKEYLDAVRAGEMPPPITQLSASPERRYRVSASRMPGSRAVWLAVQIEDITERRAIEEQLIQSEKMAAVGQLVSGVAHDLNNPITSIAGVADLLVNRESSAPDDMEHFKMIQDQAERAAHIVRNLLTFARKDPVESQAADINDIANRSASLINHEMKLRDVSLKLDLAEDLPSIRADSHELQQVVLNLLQNAVQAVGEVPEDGRREVTLRTSTDDGFLRLEIADTGPGIDAKLLPQIFLPFVTTKPPGEGTGLGLSIAYRIVQAHNGTIDARKRSPGGMSFIVSLPITSIDERQAESEESTNAALEDTIFGGSRGDNNRLSILVLDKDPAVQRALRALFAEGGHMVDATRDASQAFSLLRDNSYDLIIADARTADSEGSTFGDGLKAQFPDLCSRSLLMTADVRPETDTWLRSLGCRYLRKPFDPAELRSTAIEVLSSIAPHS